MVARACSRASGGPGRVGGLAGELGWSHRRLIARFRDAVGMPPKRVARILRFERLTALIGADPGARLGPARRPSAASPTRPTSRGRCATSPASRPTALRADAVNSVQDRAEDPA